MNILLCPLSFETKRSFIQELQILRAQNMDFLATFQSYFVVNTSLAALGALTHRLQHRTTFKIC